MRFPWRVLTVINTALLAAQILGGYWLADRVLDAWPTDDV